MAVGRLLQQMEVEKQFQVTSEQNNYCYLHCCYKKKMFTKHPRVCRLTSRVPHETPSGVLISTFGVLNKHPWGVYIIHPFLVHCYTPGVNYLKCCCYTPKGVPHTPFFSVLTEQASSVYFVHPRKDEAGPTTCM